MQMVAILRWPRYVKNFYDGSKTTLGTNVKICLIHFDIQIWKPKLVIIIIIIIIMINTIIIIIIIMITHMRWTQ